MNDCMAEMADYLHCCFLVYGLNEVGVILLMVPRTPFYLTRTSREDPVHFMCLWNHGDD